ncbi:MAG: hypothetical protein P8L47_02655 [Candidatus Marinamargulisbacteria bacterium]|nr:hypothetical protein [Candidatus Marinamargulisbacteria bacterium]
MDVSIITNSLNMITEMNTKKPTTYRGHLDSFQTLFLKEMFTEQVVESSFNVHQTDSVIAYDNTVAKQLMSQLLTNQLVKQDALNIRQIMGRYIGDDLAQENSNETV